LAKKKRKKTTRRQQRIRQFATNSPLHLTGERIAVLQSNKNNSITPWTVTGVQANERHWVMPRQGHPKTPGKLQGEKKKAEANW